MFSVYKGLEIVAYQFLLENHKNFFFPIALNRLRRLPAEYARTDTKNNICQLPACAGVRGFSAHGSGFAGGRFGREEGERAEV